MLNKLAPRVDGLGLSIAITAMSLTSPLVAQTVVSGGGNALQAAINNASPGDVLSVLMADYDAITVDRSITIEFDAGATVTGSGQPALTVQNIASSETVRIRGGLFRQGAIQTAPVTLIQQIDGTVFLSATQGNTDRSSVPSGGVMTIQSSPLGRIVIEEADVSQTGLGLDLSTIRVESCDDVRFQDCPGLSSLEFVNSNVVLVDCVVSSQLAQPNQTVIPYAMRVENSNVEVSGGTYWTPRGFFDELANGSAVSVTDNSSVVRATGGTRFIKTGIFVVPPGTLPALSGPQTAFQIDASVDLVDPLPITSHFTATSIPSIRSPQSMVPNQLDLEFRGESNQLVFGLLGTPTTPFDTPVGRIWAENLVPFIALSIPTGQTSVTTSLGIPPLLPPNLELTLQVVIPTPTNQFETSPPLCVVLP
ncbi:MAG: hypothetical protein AAF196_02610 [Planctomycetota bacterium]